VAPSLKTPAILIAQATAMRVVSHFETWTDRLDSEDKHQPKPRSGAWQTKGSLWPKNWTIEVSLLYPVSANGVFFLHLLMLHIYMFLVLPIK